MTENEWSYLGFGLTWKATFPWPIPPVDTAGAPDVDVRVDDDVDALWTNPGAEPGWLFTIDDSSFVIERGAAGDFRLATEAGARFHLDAEARVLSCSPLVRSDPQSQRLLLDTVMWTTALLHGLEGVHAGAVLTDRGAVAFLADSGRGKSSLVMELLARGYPPFCDDIVAVDRRSGTLVAHPSPPVMNVPVDAPLSAAVAPIARIGDELWVHAPAAPAEAAPLAQLLLLSRAEGLDRRVTPLAATAVDLLPHAVGHMLREGERGRIFDLCSELALTVPVARIEVDLAASPAAIADLVEEFLARQE